MKENSFIKYNRICCDIKNIQTIKSKQFQRVIISFDINAFIMINKYLSFIIVNKIYCRNCFAIILLININCDVNENIFSLI